MGKTIWRSGIDRRSGVDRREAHSAEYFEENEPERRRFRERRNSGETRSGWVRVTDWSSYFTGDGEEEDDQFDGDLAASGSPSQQEKKRDQG
jgi:hypothetical protein